MRKFSLLAVAATVGLGASIANADFVVSSSRAPNAVTIGSTSYDVVSFFVTNTNTNSTGTKTNLIDAAIYAPSHGLIIGNDTGSHPDIYNFSGNASSPYSYINTFLNNENPTGGESVLISSGGATPVFTVDKADASDNFSSGHPSSLAVAGIGAAVYWSSALQAPVITSATKFAQAVVQHGDVVELLAPGAAQRTAAGGVPATFESAATEFGVPGNASGFTIAANYVDGIVPEPASLALFGIAGAGLLARRRQTA